jgi:hypothetical protein
MVRVIASMILVVLAFGRVEAEPFEQVASFDFVLEPGVLHEFSLGPSSAHRGYVVEVTPRSTALAGSSVTAVAEPEFNGSHWIDVVRVQLLNASAAVDANIRVYAVTSPLLSFDFVLQPGVGHGFSLGPSSAHRGYVVEVTPSGAALAGSSVTAFAEPEFNGPSGVWGDVVRVVLRNASGPVSANIRVYAVTAPVLTDFDVQLQPGVRHAFALGPSSANRGYVVEVTPSSGALDGSAVTAFAEPEFNGSHWIDVVRVQLLSASAAVTANVRVYAATVTCGGDVPCGCGSTVIADRTLVSGTDAVTTTVCTGDGLFVDPGVTLDLGGSTLRGQHLVNGV